MQELSLLGLFAHPDDEQLISGTMATAAVQGIRTGLVCTTRGELGEIADPSLATPETLGKVREAEMRAAAAIIGVKYLYFLDYRDSGWIGTSFNNDPEAFSQIDKSEVLEKLVRIIREFKPTVMLTFDPQGGYGHPDHIVISNLTTEAFTAAGDLESFPEAGPMWQPERLFYCGFPRSIMERFRRVMDEMNMNTPFRDLDISTFGLRDDQITNEIDVSEWLESKEKSLRAHRTQMNPNNPFESMPPDLQRELRAREMFVMAAGRPMPSDSRVRDDLFAGLR